MNPLKTPIRFWLADLKHERWLKKANKEAKKKGYQFATLPPSKREEPEFFILHQRGDTTGTKFVKLKNANWPPKK